MIHRCLYCGGSFEDSGHFVGQICPSCFGMVNIKGTRPAVGGTCPSVVVADKVQLPTGEEQTVFEYLENPGLERLLQYRRQLQHLQTHPQRHVPFSELGNMVALLAAGLDNRISTMLFHGRKDEVGIDEARDYAKRGGTDERASRNTRKVFPDSKGLNQEEPVLFGYLRFILDARATLQMHFSPARPLDGTIFDKSNRPYSERLTGENIALLQRLYTASARIFLWSLGVQFRGDVSEDQAKDLRDQQDVILPEPPHLT